MSSHRSIPQSTTTRARSTTGLLVGAFLVLASQVTSASTLERVSALDRLTRADLIVQTTVLSISHRNSDVASADHVRLPHTFVTFAVERVFKGTATPGETITLRFLGGPDGDGRALYVSGIPHFSAGDQDILFIKDNGVADSPLVGFERGRLRLVRGEIFDVFGRELWLAPNGDFLFGEQQVDTRRPGSPPVTPRSKRATSFEAPPGSLLPDPSGLAVVLDQAILELGARGALGQVREFHSARIGEPFHYRMRYPVEPPPPVESAEPTPSVRGVPNPLERNQ